MKLSQYDFNPFVEKPIELHNERSSLIVTLSDGSQFRLAEAGSGQLEVSIGEGNLIVKPTASNNVKLEVEEW